LHSPVGAEAVAEIDHFALYGLTEHELAQPVACPRPPKEGETAPRTGTVQDMLGQMPDFAKGLAEAKAAKGLEGVKEFLGPLAVFGLKIEFHETTIARHKVHADEETQRSQSDPATARGAGDFLA